MPRSVPYKETNNRFATKWMKNALKSVGITTKDVLSEIAPNTTEFVSTGATISRDIFGVLTRNRQSVERINNAITQNKYSRALQSAYKNALSDIKTGNLNNQDRMMEAFGSDEGGFSFGEDDQSVNIDTGTPAALTTLSNQLAENTVAQVKMMKASTDAMISANAAAMFQNKQIGSEIINKLTNINNHLASIVEFNNTNLSKYIESSIAYMERTGSVIAPTEEEKKKLGINDVLRGNGGFDARNYKKLVTQQFKEYFSGTTIGQINELLTPDMLNMLAANPIGFMGKALVPKLMPAMMAESIKAVEDSFNDFLPQALMNLYTNTSKTTMTGVMGEIIRGIGETFGIKPNDRSRHGNFDLKGAKIERGPIPFDGETKHAITTIITKELRDQTSYLRVIAEHFDKNAESKASGYKTYWDWNTNSYVNKAGVDKTIATAFTDAISEAFDNTTFGKTLRQYANTRTEKEDQERMNAAITQLYTLIERTNNDNSLDINAMSKLVDQLSIDKNGKELLKRQLDQLYKTNNLGYYSARTGKVAAGNAITGTREKILQNPNNYNLIDSSFNKDMTPEEFDALINQALGYNEHDKSRNHRYGGLNNQGSSIGNMVGKYGKNILTSGADYAVKGMVALATGNGNALKGIASNIANSVSGVLKDTLTDLGGRASAILFGTSNEKTGNREGGLFSSVINETKDAFLGKADKDGKRVGGIVGSIKNAFNMGLNGWMEAFFDRKEGESDEEMRERLKKEVESRMPNTAKGAMGGALVGGLIGHPFIGAALGSAAGFMYKSETFQKWLFGEDIDPAHPDKGKTGGLISREIQEYFKKNKKDLAKNTGVGAVTGGVLGMLVGGPLTGALLGAATGLVSKTGMFQRFLFGDEKTGHKGLINGVKQAFGKGAEKYSDAELKSIGMKSIGAIGGAAFASFASTHGLLGAMMFPGGPIGGAIAGLALTIKAQEGSIKQWLFGGKKEKIGDKEFTDNGVLGKIANNLNTAIINPLRTELKFHIGNLFNRIEHHVLTPISLIAQFAAKQTVNLFKTGTGLLAGLALGPFKLLNKVLGGRLAELANIPLAIGGAAAGLAGRVISAPGRAVMSILGKFDPDLYAQGLGAKESFRENRESIRQGRKAERGFNKIDREISRLTNGRYGSDTPEAREYIKRVKGERAYRKLFLNSDGSEKESRSDVYNKANIEKEGRRLSQLFAKGDKGKVNVNAMSLEERQTYYMYKQTEYLRRILNHQENENQEEEEEGLVGTLVNALTGNQQHAATYGHNAENINNTFDRLIERTRGTGLKGFIQRRRLNAIRKANLRRAADNAFKQNDSDSLVGRAGNAVFNKFKSIFSGQGGRGSEEDDDWARWQRDHLNNKYDKDGKTAAEMKKEKEEKEHDEKIEAQLAVIAENTGGIDDLVDQEDGSKKRGIFGALSNLVSGFGSLFGKKGVFALTATALAPVAMKFLPKIIQGIPAAFKWFKETAWPIVEGIGGFVKDIFGKVGGIFDNISNFLKKDESDGAENKPPTDENGDSGYKNPADVLNNRQNNMSEREAYEYNLDRAYNLYDDDGTINNQSSSKANIAVQLARRVGIPVGKAAFKIGKAVGKVGGAVGNLVAKAGAKLGSTRAGVSVARGALAAAEHGDDALALMGAAQDLGAAQAKHSARMAAIGNTVKGAASKVGGAIKTGITTFADDAVAKGGLLGKVVGFIDDFAKAIGKGITKIMGSSAGKAASKAMGVVDDVLKGFTGVIKNGFAKIAPKISAVLSAKVTVAGVTLGVSDLIFATLGAINGVSGTAKLFHVDNDKVDNYMKAISGIFGAFSQTIPGAIIDVCLQFAYSVKGEDYLSNIACGIYNAWMSVIGKEENSEALAEARNAFKEQYLDERNETIQAQYYSQIAAGIIDSSVSYDDFIKGVEEGKYSVDYKSFADYNTEKHKSFSDKILSGLGTAFHSTKSFFAGNGDTYQDAEGNVYTKGADGMYSITDAKGNTVKTSDGQVAKVGQTTIDKMKESKSITVKDESSGLITRTKNAISNASKRAKSEDNNQNSATIAKDTKSTTAISNSKTDADRNVIYRPLDNVLTYYKLDENGKTYSLYSGNDEIIAKSQYTIEEIKNQLALGTLMADTYKPNTYTASNKQGLSSVTTAFNELWANSINQSSSSIARYNQMYINNNDFGSSYAANSGGGGRGVFYSQNDSRWGKSAYGSDGATMSDSGCGPTALAMAMSDTTGKNVSPRTMASLAEMTGDRDSTGTNWNFIGKASGMMGIGTKQQIAPSAGYLANELASGNEVVLSGRTGGYGGRGATPYTRAGHYVVATGIDANGNVMVKDPKGGMGRYSLSSLVNETGSAWSFGGHGYTPYTFDASGVQSNTPATSTISMNIEKPKTTATSTIGNDIKVNKSATIKNDLSTEAARKEKATMANAEREDTEETTSVDPEYQRWLNTIAYVKEYASKKSPRYDQQGSVTISTEDGKEFKMRLDCSGFVSACINAYGGFRKLGMQLSSAGFNAKDNMAMSDTGFIAIDWPGWENLVAGDIIARNGHVEIFAENDGEKHKVWNWGSGSSASNPGTTYSSHPSYTTVWRHPGAAPGASIAGASDTSGNQVTKADSKGASINGKATKKKVGLFEGIGNFFSSFVNKIMTGDMSKGVTLKDIRGETDDEESGTTASTYGSTASTIKSNYHGPGSDTDQISTTYNQATGNEYEVPEGNSVVSNTAYDAGSIDVTDNKSAIYDKLRSLGLSPVAAAGILGNFQAESGIKAARFEGDYSGIASSRGGLENIFSDHSKLNEYTTALVYNTKTIKDKERALNKSYRGNDGNLYPGLGLAQWTGPRGEALINFANSKGTHWTDAATQAEFLSNELTGSHASLVKEMNELQSPSTAAEKFLDKFEMNSNDGWHVGMEDSVNMDGRRQAAESIYQEFGGAGRFGGRGVSLGKSNLSSLIKDNLVVNNNNATVGSKVNAFDINTGVSKTLKRYAVSEEDIAQMLTYMKAIAENTGLSVDKLGQLSESGYGNGGNNNIFVAGNGQAPLTNYSTRSDPTTNAKSEKSRQVANKVAKGGVY